MKQIKASFYAKVNDEDFAEVKKYGAEIIEESFKILKDVNFEVYEIPLPEMINDNDF